MAQGGYLLLKWPCGLEIVVVVVVDFANIVEVKLIKCLWFGSFFKPSLNYFFALLTLKETLHSRENNLGKSYRLWPFDPLSFLCFNECQVLIKTNFDRHRKGPLAL